MYTAGVATAPMPGVPDSTMESITPIRVVAMGMDKRMQNVFHQFFRGPCHGKYLLVDDQSAEICIVDLDAYEGAELEHSYKQQHPKQPVILLSLHETQVEEAYFLRKPIKPDALVAMLEKASERLRGRVEKSHSQSVSGSVIADENTPKKKAQEPVKQAPQVSAKQQSILRPSKGKHAVEPMKAAKCLESKDIKSLIGSLHDIDLDDARQAAKIQYDPKRFLQGYLHQIFSTLESESAYEGALLEGYNGSIAISPGNHKASVNFKKSRLHGFSSLPVEENELSVEYFTSGFSPAKDIKSTWMDMDSLLWEAALWASRGRVPEGTSMDEPVYLSHWPNMTRLMLFPHAMRIAALWSKTPRSLRDTAKTLEIPQRYVFGFYSGAHALGLAGIGQRRVDTLMQPPPVQKHKKRGLFSRILGHLYQR